MAKNTQPVLKRCKTLGLSPAVLGYSKSTKRQPKQSRRKQSEYGMQLTEKQKVKFIYGVLEKQFHAYYEKAERKQGITGEILLQELERRLDNVVFRMGFANTRREARQLVNHAHFTVNGKRVNIPSFQVKPGDVIAVCEKSRTTTKFKSLIEENGTNVEVEDWGKRRLAYPIEDQTEGVYTLVRFESKPEFPAELDRIYKITDGIMRSIIVCLDD